MSPDREKEIESIALGLVSLAKLYPVTGGAFMEAAQAIKDLRAENAGLVEELRRAVAAIGVVGQTDGHDVVRRESVLDIIDRRRTSQ